jgi:CRISPR-associated protein Csx17
VSRLVLDGCRAEPLGSYLKALGVLRLVGEQLDAVAGGAWLGERFLLETAVGEAELLDFFAHRYRPTPLVAPWNGGSGFGVKDKQSAVTVAAVEASTDERLGPYRDALGVVRRLVASPTWGVGANDKAVKREQVSRCRNELPDDAVPWIDATIVLTEQDRTIAPLFVSGGNDGRLEFSANFMSNVLAALGLAKLRKGADRLRLLRSSLLGGDTGPLPEGASGPYDPGAGGGVNSGPAGDADAAVNPWDYVLMFEGGLLFASGAARRLGAHGAMMAVPFCVDVSPVGRASAVAESETARAEVWAPIWRQPATASELARFIGEGRAQWGRRPARNGVDFARAASSLGVDRGIDAFVRHALVQRFGKNHLAVALDRVEVGRRPEVRVTSQVDAWIDIDRVKRGNVPGSLSGALNRLEMALYRSAVGTGSPASALQDVLCELAGVEGAIGRGSQPVDLVRRPVDTLRATDWLPLIEEDSPEFRVAASMASGRDRGGARLALLLRPIKLDATGRWIEWREGPPVVDGLARRPVTGVLADALVRRTIDRTAGGDEGQPGQLRVAFEYGRTVALDDLALLVGGWLDEARLERLFCGLLLLDWEKDWPLGTPHRRTQAVPAALAAVGPCLTGAALTRTGRDGGPIDIRLGIEPGWPSLLASDRTADVATAALRRLRVAGLDPAIRSVAAPAATGRRLAATAFCRLRHGDLHALLDRCCPPDPRIQEEE